MTTSPSPIPKHWTDRPVLVLLWWTGWLFGLPSLMLWLLVIFAA